jgi:hypothetical protein
LYSFLFFSCFTTGTFYLLPPSNSTTSFLPTPLKLRLIPIFAHQLGELDRHDRPLPRDGREVRVRDGKHLGAETAGQGPPDVYEGAVVVEDALDVREDLGADDRWGNVLEQVGVREKRLGLFGVEVVLLLSRTRIDQNVTLDQGRDY